METSLLQLEEVSLIRPGDNGQGGRVVLEKLNLRLEQGRFSVIVGPSGGGKSSLLRLINRLEDPDSGRILFKARDIALEDPISLRRRIALVRQRPFMFPSTVAENLLQSAGYAGPETPAPPNPELRDIMDLCQLDASFLQRPARELSIGEQQRVSLGRCLMQKPELLLLDEPTSALDRPTVLRLASTLKEISRQSKISLLMVTHDLALAEKVAEDLVYLEAGRILEQGPSSRLLNNPATENLKKFLAEPLL